MDDESKKLIDELDFLEKKQYPVKYSDYECALIECDVWEKSYNKEKQRVLELETFIESHGLEIPK